MTGHEGGQGGGASPGDLKLSGVTLGAKEKVGGDRVENQELGAEPLHLTLIKGEKVDLWVRNMIDSLRRLHPVHHNVPAVWEEFKQAFKDNFVDSTHKL